ncbi:S8/S53 family peptidase [Granulicella sp. WH15]|nr:S8/S53 family peptidase [Granulicella sp. WH15]
MPASARFASQPRVTLPGSERSPFVPAAGTGEPTPHPTASKVTVSVLVRPKQPLDPRTLGQLGTRLTRAAYAKQHGPDPASLQLVRDFAAEYGLTTETTPVPHTLHLTGTCAAIQKAFGVQLKQHTIAGRQCRLREGAITLPNELDGHVLAVLGLDTRPQARPHFRVARAEAVNTSYTPVQVGQLYGFPAGATAPGQTIGILELGGGYRTADLTAYFKTLGLPAPSVTAVAVDGGKNTPGDANGADGEVMLDIEVCAAIAPGAKIVVYFAPNTDQGFIDAISTAVHDTTHKPGILSISWGGPESSWTKQSTTALDASCQAAAAVGVTITVAAGDSGSSDGGTGNNVDFPASSPHVLACGGTKLEGSGTTITSEVVWNETAADEGATGGGVSTVFPLPTWQQNANVPSNGRGVPDVAGDADPSTGYTIRVDGESAVIGGTSAVAPLWAGLIALANQQNGTDAGFLNPTLYTAPSALRDITSGNNGAYTAGPGWDACTGLGSPIGTAVIEALAGISSKPVKKPVGKTPKPVKKRA